VEWDPLHRWDVDPTEAVELQRTLAAEVVLSGSAGDAATVAGLDVAYDGSSDRLAAAAVLLDTSSLEPIDEIVVVDRVRFGYEPGLFAFRELPPLLDALGRLKTEPDLLVCDGHGYAHPQRFGLACHAGLWTGISSIGCAKTPFIGHAGLVGTERGQHAPLIDNNEVVGVALRTRTGVKPVHVSPGHLIGFDDAAGWILRMAPRFRLPEPIRAADRLARQALKGT
jgi:deoxyribonuclease V